MHKRSLCCRPVSVCLSVRPSVTLVYCIRMAEDIVKLLVLPGSLITTVFDSHAPIPNSKGTPSTEAQNRRGGKIWRFSTEIAVYFGNGMS